MYAANRAVDPEKKQFLHLLGKAVNHAVKNVLFYIKPAGAGICAYI